MKKLLTLILFLTVISCFAKMRTEIRSFNGLWYRVYYAEQRTDKFVVCIGGSGEWVKYTLGDKPDSLAIRLVMLRNSYTKYAEMGTMYPFNILAPIAPYYAGSGQANHAPIVANLPSLLTYLGENGTVLMGLSQGGQTTAGFLTESTNVDRPTTYRGANVFDGYVIMCGKPPGTPQYCAHPDKPVMLVHGTADAAVAYVNATRMMNGLNACTIRSENILMNLVYRPPTDSIWNPKDRLSQLITITGGSHSSSWVRGYDKDDPYVGKIVYKYVLSVLNPPAQSEPFECKAILDTIKLNAIFTLPDGQPYYVDIIPKD